MRTVTVVMGFLGFALMACGGYWFLAATADPMGTVFQATIWSNVFNGGAVLFVGSLLIWAVKGYE